MKPGGGSPPWGLPADGLMRGPGRTSASLRWGVQEQILGALCVRGPQTLTREVPLCPSGGDLGAVLLRASGRACLCCLCASVPVCPASGRSHGRLHPRSSLASADQACSEQPGWKQNGSGLFLLFLNSLFRDTTAGPDSLTKRVCVLGVGGFAVHRSDSRPRPAGHPAHQGFPARGSSWGARKPEHSFILELPSLASPRRLQ